MITNLRMELFQALVLHHDHGGAVAALGQQPVEALGDVLGRHEAAHLLDVVSQRLLLRPGAGARRARHYLRVRPCGADGLS